jgi:CheY-like chemotaxis protein
MPEMDGIEVARRITADPLLAGPGLVLLTSDSEDRAEESRAAGIAARLSKPVHLSQLHTTLAAAFGAGRAGNDHSPDPRAAGGRGLVLVVDDDPVNQLVAMGMLEHLGYASEVVSDGREALEAVARTSFDAVLMDCQMPGMDGFRVTEEIRRAEAGQHRLPVIAMTAGVTLEEQERCRVAGMDDFVAKPVSPDALDGALSRCLSAPAT